MTEPRFIRFDLVVKHEGSKIVEIYPFDGCGCPEDDHREQLALFHASKMAKFVLGNSDDKVSLELRMLRGDDGVECPYFEMTCSDDFLIQAMDILDRS